MRDDFPHATGPTRSFARVSARLMRSIVAVATLISGAARSAPPPTPIEIGALVAAETLLLIDLGQTMQLHHINNQFPDWAHPYKELNPLLGSNPSHSASVGYFSAYMLILAGVWYAFPKARLLAPAGSMAIEIPTVILNVNHGLGVGWTGLF